MAARRRVEGIPLADQTWRQLLEAAAEWGVAAPE
jgi:LDH2 family malate/lactate/ureidoglycolate dehydrogenase